MQSKTHRLAAEAFRKFKEEGIAVTTEEVILLNSLAHDTEKVSDPELLLYTYKTVGNLKIYPMTLGARIWLLSVGLKWFENDEKLTDLAILYTYAHSQQLEALQFGSAKEAKRAINKWARTVRATEADILKAFDVEEADEVQLEAEYLLRDVVEQLKTNPASLNLSKHTKFLQKSDGKSTEDIESNFGVPAIALLMHYYPGKKMEEWLWDTSEELCLELIEQAKKIEGGTEKETIDPNDPAIIAFNKFQKAVTHIRSRKDG